MTEEETEALKSELEQFRREKEKIRMLVGQIGGKDTAGRDRMINRTFIVLLLVFFALDLVRHFFHLSLPLPEMFSVEVGILLVSIKIIWMIHKQSRVEHFQFWILNSIEFRINDVAKRVKQMEHQLDQESSGTTQEV